MGMGNALVTDNAFATLAGPALPMGQRVVNARKATIRPLPVIVKVRIIFVSFSSFFFLPF